jgi:hypothetical protein
MAAATEKVAVMDLSLTPEGVQLVVEISAFLRRVEKLAREYRDEMVRKGVTDHNLDDCRRIAALAIGSSMFR